MMMRFIQGIHRAALLAACLAFTGPVFAQQPSPAAMATAKEVVSLTGSTAVFTPIVAGVIEQAKILFLQQNPGLAKDLNEIAAKLRTDLQPRVSEISDEVAKLYATAFTEQELKDILAFYKSPAGKKLLDQQPNVVDGSMKFAQTWGNALSEEVIGKMREELKKRGHAQ
jgi:hypothetical protein